MIKSNTFDAQAYSQPQSREDVVAIFDEIRSELANLNSHLDAIAADCEKELQAA